MRFRVRRFNNSARYRTAVNDPSFTFRHIKFLSRFWLAKRLARDNLKMSLVRFITRGCYSFSLTDNAERLNNSFSPLFSISVACLGIRKGKTDLNCFDKWFVKRLSLNTVIPCLYAAKLQYRKELSAK
jgi:hypothetical protein